MFEFTFLDRYVFERLFRGFSCFLDIGRFIWGFVLNLFIVLFGLVLLFFIRVRVRFCVGRTFGRRTWLVRWCLVA